MNKLQQNHQSGCIIGFASQFYTLWNVNCTPYYDNNGRLIGYTWRGTFVKNISKSRDRVLELYPELEIDETLHGTHSFTRYESIEESLPINVFHFGKYRGQEIAECTDAEYIAWAWDMLKDGQHTFATTALNRAGWHVINDIPCSPDAYRASLEHIAFMNTVNAGEPFNVLFASSLDCYGSYSHNGIVIHFPEYNLMYYNGYEYALPRIGGKAKRIKGKMFRIDAYTRTDDGIMVQSMSII